MKTLSRYILIETIPYFIYSLALLSFLGLLQRLMKMVNLIFTRNADSVLIFKILINFIPPTVSITIPMSILIAVLMAYGRMSGDNEIIAMRSCGINLLIIIKPVLIVSLIFGLILIGLNLQFIPYSMYQAKKYLNKLAISSPLISISENKFNKLGNILLKVEKIEPKNLGFKNLHIEYADNKNRIILAKEGYILKDKTGYSLVINNASIHQLDKNDKYKIVNPIDQMIIPINIFNSKLNSRFNKSLKMMSFFELIKFIKIYDRSNKVIKPLITARIYLIEMFVIPIACISFAFIAAPLGLISKSGKSIGFGLSFILIFIYYILLTISETISYKQIISPYIVLWFPNVLLIVIGIILIKKVIHA